MITGGPRVLVTGAAGRLGSTVAQLFHDRGFDLLATDVIEVTDTPYSFAAVDLLDHEAASALLEGVEVLVHIGNHPGIGATPPQIVFNENVSMNENMFQGAVERGVSTVVFASTLQLIGSHPDDRTVVTPPRRPTYPLSGESRPDPSNVYALSKTVSETMLRYYSERCGLAGTALRFPMLHRHEASVEVGLNEERHVDILEGFTGLTYDDAAELFLSVVRANLTGYHVFMAGTTHRHRDLTVPELLRKHYPEVPEGTPDLIDIGAVTDATGWVLGRGYHRDELSTHRSEDTQR